jgi:hypothetical protein
MFTEATVPAGDLKVGDFVDVTGSWKGVGLRGGRYANPPFRIRSAIASISYAHTKVRSTTGAPVLVLRFVDCAGGVNVPADTLVKARILNAD